MTDITTEVTETINLVERRFRDSKEYAPSIFVSIDNCITEYRLEGIKTLGRPNAENVPDIPINNRFVSRKHGYFETIGSCTYYTSGNTKNGINYKGRMLNSGDRICLNDGDVLTIPAGHHQGSSEILLIYASSSSQKRIWHEMSRKNVDKLTGLYRRENILNWWGQVCRHPQYRQASIFIMDADEFKMINDNYGHATGDMVLRIIGSQILKNVHDKNHACRWGGDEFVGVLLESGDQLKNKLLQLRSDIQIISAQNNIPATVSIGCVSLANVPDITSFDHLVDMADKMLYQAKRGGKNRFIIR